MAITTQVHSFDPSSRVVEVEFKTTYPAAAVTSLRNQASAWGILSPTAAVDPKGIRLRLINLSHWMCTGDQDAAVTLLRGYVKDVWTLLKNKVKSSFEATIDPAPITSGTFDAE